MSGGVGGGGGVGVEIDSYFAGNNCENFVLHFSTKKQGQEGSTGKTRGPQAFKVSSGRCLTYLSPKKSGHELAPPVDYSTSLKQQGIKAKC